jgi:hypothetical protein
MRKRGPDLHERQLRIKWAQAHGTRQALDRRETDEGEKMRCEGKTS